MQIHELNTFSGTPSSSNYLAIDDGTDTGKISGESLLAPVNTRIDNLVSGVTVDSEVIDGRVGADGVTYGSLGTAIRTQVSDLKSDINLNKDGYTRLNASDFVVGTLVDGEWSSDTRRVCNSNVVSYDYDVTILPNSGYRYNIHYFDSSDAFTSESKWTTAAFTIPRGTRFKLNLAEIPDRATSIHDIAEFLTHFAITTGVGSKVLSLSPNFEEFKNGVYLYDKALVPNSYVATNGNIVVYEGWCRTDYIPVKSNNVIHFNNTVSSQYNAFYDANKSFVSAFTIGVGADIAKTVPSNARYMICSNSNSAMQSLEIWSDVDGMDVASTHIVAPYYFKRFTGDIVNGMPISADGAFVKFSNIDIKTKSGATISLAWAKAKSDLSSNPNASFGESYDLTADCLRLYKNFILIYDLDTNAFDIQYTTAYLPSTAVVLFGSDADSNPFGVLYEQAKGSVVNGISNYIDDIESKENDVLPCADNFAFSFATDIHYYFDQETGYFNSTNELLSKLDNDFCLDAIINGGDNICYGSKNRAKGLSSLTEAFENIPSEKALFCVGNHDYNGVGTTGSVNKSDWMLDNDGIITMLVRHNKNVVRPSGKRYFYRDFEDKKVRVIVLDTQDIDITFDGSGAVELDPLRVYGIRQAQIEWLCDTALNVPSDDWKVLVVMHVGLYTSEDGFVGNEVLINRDSIRNIFNKYVSKSAYSYADTDTTYDGYFTVGGSGTFASYHGTLVAVLSGHSHADGYTNKNGFNAIQTICSYPDIAQHPTRTVRTFDEVAVDVGYIDTTNEKIVLKRFGYGDDREYNY